MKLELDIGPSGTYEMLTSVITVDVNVSCTRAATVYLEAAVRVPYSEVPLLSSPGGNARTAVRCPGPAGQTFTTKWESSDPTTSPNPVGGPGRLINMYGKTYEGSTGTGSTPVVDRDDAFNGDTVTFTRILCWQGAPAGTPA